jgi:LacI family transcriptional regulator
MVTIYDIAKATGVSPPTVSKALNNQSDISEGTKERIARVAKDLGYIPNSNAISLITKKSWMIGIIYEEDHLGIGLEHPLFAGIMNAFKGRMEAEGYELLFIARNLGSKKMSLLDHCRYRQMDGVLILNCNAQSREVDEVIKSGLPIVSANNVFPDACTVTSDNIRPSEEVVRYFYGLGHRRIAHISGPMDPVALAGQERLLGYRQGLDQVGLPFDPDLVVEAPRWNPEAGYRAMKELLQKKIDATALYCAGDILAVGALQACGEEGVRIPEDISVVGFDDIDWASYAHPPLTTFRQDRKAIGVSSAESLLKQLRGKKVERRLLIPVEFVKRQSCVILQNTL